MSSPKGSDRLAKLANKAAEAAAIRAHQTHPDVVALTVERVRFQVDALLWVAIVAGLGFTMVNVQEFAAEGRAPGSLGWWTAWLLDPMVSLALLAVLRAEQVTARYQVKLPAWAHRTKWFAFAATYVMNTWKSWGLDANSHFSLSGVVLHSVPPLVVFAAAETGPGLRDRLTEAVRVAMTEAQARMATDQPAATATVVPSAGQPAEAALATASTSTPAIEAPSVSAGDEANAPGREVAATRRPPRKQPKRSKQPAPRRLFGDYLTEARAQLTAGIEPTPAWCRQVTGCGKTVSVELAKALRAELAMPRVPTTTNTDDTNDTDTDTDGTEGGREAAA